MGAKHIKIKNKKKFIISTTFLVLILISIFVGFFWLLDNYLFKAQQTASDITADSSNHTSSQDFVSSENIPQDTSVTLAVIGDIMCHNTQYKDAYQANTGTYNFSYVFSELKDKLASTDLTIGNLETTFAGNGRAYSSYPTFNTPEALATSLKDIGIDILSTANNHSLDTGFNGLSNTLNVLDNLGIKHMGTYRTEEEQNSILVHEINGIKFAFLSYTYGTNGIPIPSGKDFCVNLISEDLILRQIEQAKSENVDVICVSMHWGTEYLDVPNKEQERLADFLFENGVDIILGSHPHVLEKMEKRTVTTKDGKTKDGFVIYSLGNFVSGQVKKNTRSSIILNMTVTKRADGNISIDSIDYTPIYCYTASKSKGYKLIDIAHELELYEAQSSNYINSSNATFYKNELERIHQVLGWIQE